jgi:hypothetical protein
MIDGGNGCSNCWLDCEGGAYVVVDVLTGCWRDEGPLVDCGEAIRGGAEPFGGGGGGVGVPLGPPNGGADGGSTMFC